MSRWDLGRGCTGVILAVKELGSLNVRSVVALYVAQYVPRNEDQHPLPKSNLCLSSRCRTPRNFDMATVENTQFICYSHSN